MTNSHQRHSTFAAFARRGSISAGSLAARSLLLLAGLAGCTDPMSVFAPSRSPVVETLTITPADVRSLALGQLVTLQVIARADNGAALNVPIAWTNSEPEVVRLQKASGYASVVSVVAQRAGSSTLTARSGQGTVSVLITVHAPGPVATISLLTAREVALGKMARLVTVQRDSEGVVLAMPAPLFSTSDLAIATVSASGLVTALAEGTVTLTATSEGKSASRTLTVIPSEHAFIWTAASGMIDVGTLPGFVSNKALALSAAGHVAGTMSTIGDSLSHAFVRSPGANAELRDLGGLPGGKNSEAFGVNSAGQVVGYAMTASGVKHAVLWQPNGTLVDFGATTGGPESVALGISESGQVVGWTGTSAQMRPFIWTETGGIHLNGEVSNGTAYAINTSGKVVGDSRTHPISWNPGSSTSLLPLLPGNDVGRALAISDAGEMVGYSRGCDDAYYYSNYYDDCDGLEHPVMWASNNVPTDLRRIASASTIAFAAGINSAHEIVGRSDNHRAILWSLPAGLRDLGVLRGRVRSAATAINDAGVVVGSSSNQ